MNQNQKDCFVAFLKDLPGESSRSLSDNELMDLKSRVMEVVNRLDPMEKDIINCLYGFGDNYVYKPKEVRRIFKMSTEVVEQNRRSALKKVATFLDVIYSHSF